MTGLPALPVLLLHPVPAPLAVLVLPHGLQHQLEHLPVSEVHVDHVPELLRAAVEQDAASDVVAGDGVAVGLNHGTVETVDTPEQQAHLQEQQEQKWERQEQELGEEDDAEM